MAGRPRRRGLPQSGGAMDFVKLRAGFRLGGYTNADWSKVNRIARREIGLNSLAKGEGSKHKFIATAMTNAAIRTYHSPVKARRTQAWRDARDLNRFQENLYQAAVEAAIRADNEFVANARETGEESGAFYSEVIELGQDTKNINLNSPLDGTTSYILQSRLVYNDQRDPLRVSGDFIVAATQGETQVFSLPKDVSRAYAIYTKIGEKREEYEEPEGIQFKWLPLAAYNGDIAMWEGKENCCAKILKEKYPARAEAIGKIRLRGDGGWGKYQSEEASKLLKKNIILKDRAEGVIYEVGGHKESKKNPPLVIYDGDKHAHLDNDLPKVLSGVSVIPDKSTYDDVRKLVPADALVWKQKFGYVANEEKKKHVYKFASIDKEVNDKAQHIGFGGDVSLLSSGRSVVGKQWKEKNGIEPTCKPFLHIWKDVEKYPVMYCTEADSAVGYDLNQAWASAAWHTEAAYYYRIHGSPVAGTEIVFSATKDQPIPLTAIKVTGASLITVDLERSHPYVALQLGQEKVWVSNMRLHAWMDYGMIRIKEIHTCIQCRSHRIAEMDECATKEEKREIIGTLAPQGGPATICTKFRREADNIVYTLAVAGKFKAFREIYAASTTGDDFEDVLLELTPEALKKPSKRLEPISFEIDVLPEPGPCPTASYHAHATILGAGDIAVSIVLSRLDWKEVVKVKTDAIYTKTGLDLLKVLKGRIGKLPGQWKKAVDSAGKSDYKKVAMSKPRNWAALPPTIAGGPFTDIFATGLALIYGPAGFGKTEEAKRVTKNQRTLHLTHTCFMMDKFLKEGRRARTLAAAFLTDGSIVTEMYEEEKIVKGIPTIRVKKPKPLPTTKSTSIIHLVEAGMFSMEVIIALHKYCLAAGIRLLLDGDDIQMKNHKAEAPWGYLWGEADDEASPDRMTIHTMTKDYRSADLFTSKLKLAVRGKTNAEGIAIIRKLFPSATYDEKKFLATWDPADMVLISTHAKALEMAALLDKIHREKYPRSPKPYIYKSGMSKSGQVDLVPLGDEAPAGSKSFYCVTFHAVQGHTVEDPKMVWIFTDKTTDLRKDGTEWCENAIYVGVSRVQCASQIGIVE
jgi:hypothetical protein